jgi:predicted nucleic acid-binding protein
MSYWDTSCLVKLYSPEPDSAAFVAYVASSHRCVTSDLAVLEFWATVRRKEAEGALGPGEAQIVLTAFQNDVQFGVISVVESDAAVRAEYFHVVERCLSQSPPIFIRTNDALHLAAARCTSEKEIVATDKRLREAAVVLGFALFPLP